MIKKYYFDKLIISKIFTNIELLITYEPNKYKSKNKL